LVSLEKTAGFTDFTVAFFLTLSRVKSNSSG